MQKLLKAGDYRKAIDVQDTWVRGAYKSAILGLKRVQGDIDYELVITLVDNLVGEDKFKALLVRASGHTLRLIKDRSTISPPSTVKPLTINISTNSSATAIPHKFTGVVVSLICLFVFLILSCCFYVYQQLSA